MEEGYLPIQNVSLITYLIDNQLIKVIIGCSEQQPSNKNAEKQREKSLLLWSAKQKVHWTEV